LYNNSAFSQATSPNGIAVTVVDSATRHPLQDADVILFDKIQNRVISSFVTDSAGYVFVKGSFHPDSSDKLFLQFYVLGHHQKTISLNSEQLIEGKITVALSSKSTALKDVMISHVRNPVSFEGNKMVYDFKSIPNYEGMTSAEILNYLPFLNVEDNQIKMMGRDVVILINNRPHPYYNNIQNLKSLPPQAIERIELSFVPSARYGMNKVLNITLKKNYFLGWNGNFNIGVDRFGYSPSGSLG
jgi:iron complex outermembrane recepter protein